MDEVDRTEANAELYSKTALYKSIKPEPNVIPTGECLYCGEPVAVFRRWCDAECRDDWVAENERDT